MPRESKGRHTPETIDALAKKLTGLAGRLLTFKKDLIDDGCESIVITSESQKEIALDNLESFIAAAWDALNTKQMRDGAIGQRIDPGVPAGVEIQTPANAAAQVIPINRDALRMKRAAKTESKKPAKSSRK